MRCHWADCPHGATCVHAIDTETDCPNCSRVLHVHDLCECDHELGPYCGPCCRAYHQERP